MKKVLVLILALCLMAALAACGEPSDDEIKAVRNVSFEGTELTVTLGTNKSTGYEWDYEIHGECVEPTVGSSFKITGTQGDATGEVSIVFEGTKEGTAVLLFTTPNGWDGTGAGDAYTVNVEVSADKTIVSAVGEVGNNAPKTSVTIDELKEGAYTGTLSGVEITTSTTEGITASMYTAVSPADITVTIENGQITLYCEAIARAYAVLEGVETPRTSEYPMILSGSLLLQQSGDAVTAEGEVPADGQSAVVYHTDGVFDRWELIDRAEDETFTCGVHIAMENGVPVAEITVGVRSVRTATVPLELVSGTEAAGSDEPLSAPYAELLKSGDYQYTYSLDYEGEPYTATIATYDGMICRKVVSEDGTFSQRVVTIDGNAWKIDDLTGTVVDGGTENAETLPDYAGTLTFVSSGTLETGAIGDAYDFEHEGQKCNMVFLFTPEGELVSLVVTVDEETSTMDILSFGSVGNDRTLFDAPQ